MMLRRLIGRFLGECLKFRLLVAEWQGSIEVEHIVAG